MHKAFFLTGTDTEVGKTFIACALLHYWRDKAHRVVAYKPVAAGTELIDGQVCNADAMQLLRASSPGFELARINPVCLTEAIAPHIAAKHADCIIDMDQLVAGFDALRPEADRLIVEGAGGFVVPLSENTDLSQLAQRLGLPVILVVGLRLGCLNHALLTAEAIRARGLALAGWIANVVDESMPCLDENVATLHQRLAAPCLGIVPRVDSPRAAVRYLRLESIET